MEGKGKWVLIGGGLFGCLVILCAAGGIAAYFLLQSRGGAATTPTVVAEPSPAPTEAPEPLPVPTSEATGAQPEAPTSGAAFELSNFRFLGPDEETDNGGVYEKGQRIRYAFDINGLSRDSSNRWSVKMDLTVTNPSGEVVLDRNIMVEEEGDMADPLPLSGYVDLPPEAPTGTYQFHAVTLDIRANAEKPLDRTFEVQAPSE